MYYHIYFYVSSKRTINHDIDYPKDIKIFFMFFLLFLKYVKCCENRPFITLNNAHRKVQIPRIITDKVSWAFVTFASFKSFYIFTLENVLNYAKWNCANIQSIRTTKVFLCQFVLLSFRMNAHNSSKGFTFSLWITPMMDWRRRKRSFFGNAKSLLE